MDITIRIDEEKVTDHIEKLIAEQIAKELGAGREHLSCRYHVEVRSVIREVMRENFDMLAKEAVSAAAKSIENRAIKNKLMKALEE